MARDLCGKDRDELDMLFSFEHMETDEWFVKWFPRKFKPKRFFKVIARWQKELALYLKSRKKQLFIQLSTLKAEAEIAKNFGAYIKSLNLLDSEYQIWQGYAERPFQLFVGITYKF